MPQLSKQECWVVTRSPAEAGEHFPGEYLREFEIHMGDIHGSLLDEKPRIIWTTNLESAIHFNSSGFAWLLAQLFAAWGDESAADLNVYKRAHLDLLIQAQEIIRQDPLFQEKPNLSCLSLEELKYLRSKAKTRQRYIIQWMEDNPRPTDLSYWSGSDWISDRQAAFRFEYTEEGFRTAAKAVARLCLLNGVGVERIAVTLLHL